MDHESATLDDHTEPEVIRQQMVETRSALTEKLEMLEQQVTDTVQDTSAAVTDTVGTVKDAVQEAVQSVKESVRETVESVKESFDVTRQVRNHPWAMVSGAMAVGFIGGLLLPSSRRPRFDHLYGPPPRGATKSTANGYVADASAIPTHPLSNKPGWLTEMGETFKDEMAQVKGMAIGAMCGLVRDLVTRSVPKPLERQVEDVINGFTTKLGGKLVHGPILPQEPHGTRT